MTSSPFVLLDDSLTPGGSSFYLADPQDVILCDDPQDVEAALKRISDGLAHGYHAAGFFSYELGYLMEPKLTHLLPANLTQPLIWMGLFKTCERWSEQQVHDHLQSLTNDSQQQTTAIESLVLSMEKGRYLEAYQKTQDYISAGDIYQINLTLKYFFQFKGNPLALYRELRRKQKVAYGGVIATPDFHVLSLSPELFFAKQDGKIFSRPMKGTAPRGLTPQDDKKIIDWLKSDEKSRAENLMIVDLLRNDLGRIAQIGTVNVTDLFTVETYRTVHQMTSGISATLKPALTLQDILHAIFPCGSVTGAPKVRAMEIIHELEDGPRGIYTGAMGMISPDGTASFNVPIRTIMLDKDGNAEMGIGSGVVTDSQAEAEFEECLLKAHFLTLPDPSFQLIETLRWQKDKGYYLLDRHLARLERSANHFGFQFNKEAVIATLEKEAAILDEPVHMVRLLLDERGHLTTSNIVIELPTTETIWSFALSDKPVDQDDIAFYHKTTKRDLFTAEYDRYHEEFGVNDVIFLNKNGELTEGSRTNIFLKIGEKMLTPPVTSGLLPGTLREELIQSSNMAIEVSVLTLSDLENAEKIYLGNSVRGLVEAKWANKPH